jgi:predicted aldo/keto reductase-like oxidoreductase
MAKKQLNRRDFLRLIGVGTLTATAGGVISNPLFAQNAKAASASLMTLRVNRHTGDKVSLLGYGCMRWPKKNGVLDQVKINEMVSYALAHGINYYDTAPAYGDSEASLGIALQGHPRKSYFVATKMSNFSQSQQSYAASVAMYKESMRRLHVDYIDYYLLHGVGMGGMDSLKARFIDNGVLDFLLAERKAGRIRNLGFSYHGEIEVFNYLLAQDIKWDFAQIELNYVDWKHAQEMNPRNYDAEYLYNELEKHNIQAVIMEPLLGGRLAKLNDNLSGRLKAVRPEATAASWGFRYAGSLPNVLTVLSGMGEMAFVEENINTFSPLDPCTQQELATLEDVAKIYCSYPMIPCTGCHYCMPCPFNLDIPANFAYYNKCVNDGTMPVDPTAADYKAQVKAFLDGYAKTVPETAQASHCASCNHCVPHCPQHIQIPAQMKRITAMVEEMKKVVGQ